MISNITRNRIKEIDRFTTPPQQLHNTPSHEGGVQCVGLTPM
jgi:hypothetical protein